MRQEISFSSGTIREHRSCPTIGIFSLSDMASGVKPRNEEILDEILSFLRQGSLHCYAAAREAYSLRHPEEIAPDAKVGELFSTPTMWL